MKARDEIGTYLNSLGLIGAAVEIGVFRADFSRQLLSTWHGKMLVLVDPWKHLDDYLDSWNLSNEAMEENYQLVRQRLAEFTARISILRMRSEDAFSRFSDGYFDFVHIDANHAYEAVRRDISGWYPKLKRGGLMSGHDYFDAKADEELEPIFGSNTSQFNKAELTSYGVKSAVDEFTATLGVDLHVIDEFYPTWYFIKK